MNEWITLQITNAVDRESVALALYRAGYTVRQKKGKEGKRSVTYLEYRKSEVNCAENEN